MRLLIIFFWVFLTLAVVAQGQTLRNQSLSMSGSSISVEAAYLSQTIGQQSVIGSFQNSSGTLRQGFQQPALKASVIEEATDLEATVFPNPVRQNLNVQFVAMPTQTINTTVWDMLGRQVISNQFSPAQNITLDLSTLAAGNYILKVQSGTEVITVKLLKR